jgi:hypothetical protein
MFKQALRNIDDVLRKEADGQGLARQTPNEILDETAALGVESTDALLQTIRGLL